MSATTSATTASIPAIASCREAASHDKDGNSATSPTYSSSRRSTRLDRCSVSQLFFLHHIELSDCRNNLVYLANLRLTLVDLAVSGHTDTCYIYYMVSAIRGFLQQGVVLSHEKERPEKTSGNSGRSGLPDRHERADNSSHGANITRRPEALESTWTPDAGDQRSIHITAELTQKIPAQITQNTHIHLPTLLSDAGY